MLTPSEKKYLLAVYKNGGGRNGVSNSRIADSLDVSRPGVTRAMNNLEKKELVSRGGAGEVSLTPLGLRLAYQLYLEFLEIYEYLTEDGEICPKSARKDAMACVCQLSETGRKGLVSCLSQIRLKQVRQK